MTTGMTMRYIVLTVLTLALLAGTPIDAVSQANVDEQQVERALSPLPAALRSTARVIGWENSTLSVVLREGRSATITAAVLTRARQQTTTGFTCVADNPDTSGFSVSCFNDAVANYEIRLLQVLAEGVSERQAETRLLEEIEVGRLNISSGGIVHRQSGASPDDARGSMLIFVPGATAPTVGLPTFPTSAAPWLKLAGTSLAHIVVPSP